MAANQIGGRRLRSIVDLQATQTLRTKTGSNNPFDFSFDDSQTRLSVALDTPLNRRLQRNNFRVALISYNVGLRNLIAAEDAIKLDVREDLRQLAWTVTSTRLQSPVQRSLMSVSSARGCVCSLAFRTWRHATFSNLNRPTPMRSVQLRGNM